MRSSDQPSANETPQNPSDKIPHSADRDCSNDEKKGEVGTDLHAGHNHGDDDHGEGAHAGHDHGTSREESISLIISGVLVSAGLIGE
jgi:hypothetical protein